MNLEQQKKAAAEKAITLIKHDMVIGVGTGSTVKCFIEALAKIKHKIEATVSSSDASTQQLKNLNIPVIDLNSAGTVDIYVDGADEINPYKQMIKGGGGALTREKIIANCAKKIICIADASKQVDILGKFPLPIEVIPMARSFIAREMVKLGGQPVYREGFVTDNGNVILDIHGLSIINPTELETKINQLPGVITNGLFSIRPADEVIIGS